MLKPVAVYPDGARTNGALVMCEVMMPDGETPHASNKRATILDDDGAWFGFEQEYFFYKDGRPLGFPTAVIRRRRARTTPASATRMSARSRARSSREHLDLCLAAGINHEGINAEVAKGQWEFQIFGKGSKKAADEMWMARYLMQRLTEKLRHRHRVSTASRSATPTGTARACTPTSRPPTCARVGGKDYFEELMEAFEKNLMDHIAVYGPDNDMRLTGKHETAPWNKFSYGVADRGASIRVPHSFIKNGLQGLSGRPPPELAGRPLPDRFADPEDDRAKFRPPPSRPRPKRPIYARPGWGRPGCNLIRQGKIALADHCVLMTVDSNTAVQSRSPAL